MNQRANIYCRRNVFRLLGILLVPTFWYMCMSRTSVFPPAINRINWVYRETTNQRAYLETSYNVHVEKEKMGSSVFHDKWIVLTTFQNPTKQIEALSKLTQWKIVVLGDKIDSAEDCRNCIFLDTEAQMALGYSITRLLPYDSYVRKSIGYLYAIEHGAKVIYETHYDNSQLDELYGFALEDTMYGLVYNAPTLSVVNPYAHFGQPDFWPRGYPDEETGSPPPEDFLLRKFKRPSIQQGLVNNVPDVNAISDLIKKDHNKSAMITFDKRAPPVVLPSNLYAPLNSKNTLWHYESFWLMMLPATTSLRVCDIWRGYWAQRLLQEINGTLGFFPPNANLIRNAQSLFDDHLHDVAAYKDAGRLINFLRTWSCDKSVPFSCLVSLTRDMAIEGFWTQAEVELAESWINDMRRIGYREPETQNEAEKPARDISKVIFKPNHINAKRIDICSGHNVIRQFCTPYIPTLCKDKQPENDVVFDNVLLVLEFNNPFYANIEIMEAMYGNAFPNRVYCGDWDAVQLSSIPKNINLKFVTMETRHGYYGYGCMIRAIEMGYSVDGYLYVSDDVLIKFRGIRKHTVDKMWFFPLNPNRLRNKIRKGPLGQLFYSNQTKVNAFIEWNEEWGRDALFNSLHELHDMEATDTIDRNISQSFLKRLSGGEIIPKTVWHHNSDAFYIPRVLSRNFQEVASVFLKNHVYLGLAVPNLILGLGEHAPFHDDDSVSVHTGNTACVDAAKYNNYKDVCHRMKLSLLLKEEKVQNAFCSRWVNDQLLTTR